MQMAGDFAVARGCAEGSWRNVSGPSAMTCGETPADILRRIGIVIAGDPDPIAAALQSLERCAADVRHAIRPAAIVKAVAERNDETRRITLDQHEPSD
jgi:hypothetical protein